SPPECHETGRTYEYIAGPPLTVLQEITVEEREVLIRCARSFTREAKPVESAPARERCRHEGNSLRPGDDFDLRGSWQEILAPHGWTLLRGSWDDGHLRRAGKSQGSLSATVGVCRGPHGEPLLHVFSSNAQPFEDGQTYGRFRAYATLNHHGDLSAAAGELAKKGYGEQRNGHAPSRNGHARAMSQVGDACEEPDAGPTNNEDDCRFHFNPIHSAIFARSEYRVEWLVKRLLVRDQPGVVGGAM